MPSAVAWALEPPLLLWAAQTRRRPRAIALALAGVGVASGLAIGARSFAALAAALSVWYVAIGVASGLAQAELMDAAPEARAESLARWSAAGALGDLLAPALVSGSLALGASYRGALAAVALASLLGALWLASLSPPAPSADVEGRERDEDPAPLTASRLRAALADRALLAWVLGAALCDLLDEAFVALAALRVHARFGARAEALAAVLGAYTFASCAALVLVAPLLARVAPMGLLRVVCLGSIGALAGFALADSLLWLTLFAALAGALEALQYPLAQARAYEAAPLDSGLVAALGSAAAVVPLGWPLLLGLLADRFGLTLALWALLAQPLGLLLVLARAPRATQR